MGNPLHLFYLAVAILGLVLCSPVSATSFGVYHLSAKQAASSCTSVRVPPKLCPSCLLKPFKVWNTNVNFGGINRFDIYNLSSPGCQEAIREYVAKNPCDTTRRTAFNNQDKLSGRKALIYFMYSVCEACCDCIPIGAREDHYEWRRKAGKLINIKRGNCAAHFFFDTCKVWPNVGRVVTTQDNSKKYPWVSEWCPDFKKWQFSPDSNGWLKNNNVKGTTFKMRRGMTMLMRTTQCWDKTQWQNCVRMERAQQRV